MIICKCDFCGKDFNEYPSNVKNNKNNYCNNKCKNNSLIGQKVYRENSIHLKSNDQLKNLTLVVYTFKGNRCVWECKCSCGNIVFRREDYLKKLIKEDRTISCGCQNPLSQKGSKSKKWKGLGKLSAHYFQTIKNRAAKKGIEFNITMEYIWNLFLKQDCKCVISGVDIIISESKRTKEEMTASLDRKDSSIGYIEGNVQWVHKIVNKMKNDTNEKEFIEWCQLISTMSLSKSSQYRM